MNVTIVDYNSCNISSVINSFKDVSQDKVNIEVNSDLNKIWNKQYEHINKNYNSQKVLDDWIYVYNNL